MPDLPEVLKSDDERGQAISLFQTKYGDFSTLHSLREFKRARQEVAEVVDPSGISHGGDFLFSYFGVEALPTIFPNSRPAHLAIDYASQRIDLLSEEYFAQLPPHISGVPTKVLFNAVAQYMTEATVEWAKSQGKTSASRIEIADGRCFLASPLAQQLTAKFPRLKDDTFHLRIDFASRREKFPPYLRPLSSGHSIVGIKYQDEEDTDQILLIDPTIAQVDLDNSYDIEATTVPTQDYQDYLRLRYRTLPQVFIREGRVNL